MTRVGRQMLAATGVPTGVQAKPLGQGAPPEQLCQHVEFTPPSKETHSAARPRTSAGQLAIVVQVAEQMRSPEPAERQLKPAGQSLLVKQKS